MGVKTNPMSTLLQDQWSALIPDMLGLRGNPKCYARPQDPRIRMWARSPPFTCWVVFSLNTLFLFSIFFYKCFLLAKIVHLKKYFFPVSFKCFFKFPQFLSSIFFSSVSPEQDIKDRTEIPKSDIAKFCSPLLSSNEDQRLCALGWKEELVCNQAPCWGRIIAGSQNTWSVSSSPSHTHFQQGWPLQLPHHRLATTWLENGRRGVSDGRPSARAAQSCGRWELGFDGACVCVDQQSSHVSPAAGPRGASVPCCASR